jgi:serine/threonine protein phosphatase PrpC
MNCESLSKINGVNITENNENENEEILQTYFSNEIQQNNTLENDNKIKQFKKKKISNPLIEKFKNYISNRPITVYSKKSNCISSFSAYSYKNGKKYNEDKLHINLNIKINNKNYSFYSVYDGHGGDVVSNYLKDNLQNEIIKHIKCFEDINQYYKKIILESFENIECDIMKQSKKDIKIKKSGSCALILITNEDNIYIANLGDSRGIICSNNNLINILSIDHKPRNEYESQRVYKFGGKIEKVNDIYRIFPGGLSVARTIGDSESKLPEFGGVLNIISSTPDLLTFKNNGNIDFIILGCDGIYDNLSNKKIVYCVYYTLLRQLKKNDVVNKEKIISKITKNIIKEALKYHSKDNLSCIFLTMEKFEKLFNKEKTTLNKIQLILEKLNEIHESKCNLLYENIDVKYFPFSNLYIKKSDLSHITNKTGFMKGNSSINHTSIKIDDFRFSGDNFVIEGKTKDFNEESGEETETSNPNKTIKVSNFCCGLFS